MTTRHDRAAQQLRQRGKAPPLDYSFGSLRSHRQRKQLANLTITPIEQVHGQSANKIEIKASQPNNLRRTVRPKRVEIQKGGERSDPSARPASAKAEFAVRVGGTVML
jgi:hypothetical protein